MAHALPLERRNRVDRVFHSNRFWRICHPIIQSFFGEGSTMEPDIFQKIGTIALLSLLRSPPTRCCFCTTLIWVAYIRLKEKLPYSISCKVASKLFLWLIKSIFCYRLFSVPVSLTTHSLSPPARAARLTTLSPLSDVESSRRVFMWIFQNKLA